MELWALQSIADGTVSLAELEAEHPVLGRNLKDFISTINRCCRDAYERFSSCLDDVLTLPNKSSDASKAAVIQKLRDASSSDWFRDVARICDDLAAVANTYDTDIRKHIDEVQVGAAKDRHSLSMLLMILHKHEGDLKEDIRHAVDHLMMDLSDSKIAGARQRAMAIKDEINRNLMRINGVAVKITGSSSDSANEILTKAQVVEAALRRPERVLLFNMAWVIALFVVGATVMQYISLVAFPLLTAFVLTAVIVLNAFYLRSIEILSEESFMELMKLALLKFFAPLMRPNKAAKR